MCYIPPAAIHLPIFTYEMYSKSKVLLKGGPLLKVKNWESIVYRGEFSC